MSEIEVRSVEETTAVLSRAMAMRMTGATKMNAQSSRYVTAPRLVVIVLTAAAAVGAVGAAVAAAAAVAAVTVANCVPA